MLASSECRGGEKEGWEVEEGLAVCAVEATSQSQQVRLFYWLIGLLAEWGLLQHMCVHGCSRQHSLLCKSRVGSSVLAPNVFLFSVLGVLPSLISSDLLGGGRVTIVQDPMTGKSYERLPGWLMDGLEILGGNGLLKS
jgi:hypothetical protein